MVDKSECRWFSHVQPEPVITLTRQMIPIEKKYVNQDPNYRCLPEYNMMLNNMTNKLSYLNNLFSQIKMQRSPLFY